MSRFAVGLVILSGLAACNQSSGPSEAPDPEAPEGASGSRVGGRVRGLWDGAAGVRLQLKAAGVDAFLDVSSNGTFRFDSPLKPGTSYTVAVAASPAQHSCIVDGDISGLIVGEEVTSISVACTGPAVAIALSGMPWWSFDPTQEAQTIKGSVAMQEVALTISSSALTSASIDGAAVRLGEPTPPVALPLGARTMAISLAASGGLSKRYQLTFDRGASVLDQLAYGKASNTGAGDSFGWSISLSGDTLAVGAPKEASGNANPADNSARDSGAVYVFVRSGTSWSQQAYLKASVITAGSAFGGAVSLSGDTLAVGADEESSGNGNPADNSAPSSGAVYVFVRSGTSWSQQAYLKASTIGGEDRFGGAVSLSGDTLAVGATWEDSGNGNPADNSARDSGAVYVFARSGTAWSQQAYLKASTIGAVDYFGGSVSLSGDTLAVGAAWEDSGNGNPADNGASDSGAVYVFVRSGTAWSQQTYLKASTIGREDRFGGSVSLSGDTLAIGADGEASGNANPADNSARGSGAVYVFVRSGTAWSQQAYLKASTIGAADRFGASISLSGDRLAVGAVGESSAATGINGSQANDSAYESGAVYVFVRSGASWSRQDYLKASNTGARDYFGISVSLTGDALAVGAMGEASAATGLNGNQVDNSAFVSGAVYLYR